MKRNKVLEAEGVVALSTVYIVLKFLNYQYDLEMMSKNLENGRKLTSKTWI